MLIDIQFMYFCKCTYLVVDCGPAPVFDNTNIVITNDNASSCNFTTNTNSTLDNCTNSIGSQYNATLYTNKTTYVCDSYRFFSTGELSKVSECQADGNWSITEGCSGKRNSVNHRVFILYT